MLHRERVASEGINKGVGTLTTTPSHDDPCSGKLMKKILSLKKSLDLNKKKKIEIDFDLSIGN